MYAKFRGKDSLLVVTPRPSRSPVFPGDKLKPHKSLRFGSWTGAVPLRFYSEFISISKECC